MRKQRGFTILELVIVIFMMALVGGALLVNFRQGEKQRRVNLMRDTVISALRTAQNYTLSGRQIPPPGQAPHVRGPARCVNDNAALSYWVEFTPGTTFYIMAEDRCGAIMRAETFYAVDKTKFLDSNSFQSTSGGTPTSSDNLAVRFVPPFANMTVSSVAGPLPGGFANFTSATITFQHQDGNASRSVTVDGVSGRID